MKLHQRKSRWKGAIRSLVRIQINWRATRRRVNSYVCHDRCKIQLDSDDRNAIIHGQKLNDKSISIMLRVC